MSAGDLAGADGLGFGGSPPHGSGLIRQYGGSVLRVSVWRAPGRSCVAFYDLEPEVTGCPLRSSHKPNRIQAEGILTPSPDGKLK